VALNPSVPQAQRAPFAPDRVEVRLVCGRTLNAAEVTALLRTHCDWPLRVEISYPPRSRAGRG